MHLSATLAQLPDVIDSLGLGTYSGIYGGLVGVDGGQQVKVYLTRLDPVIETAFSALAPAGVVSFVQTPPSWNYLRGIQQQVLDGMGAMRQQDIQVQEFWPDIDTGLEKIGVINLTDTARGVLDAAYGADSISVFNVDPSDLPELQVDRTHDTSPYNGGDSITDGVEGCSTGFGFTSNSNGQTYMLTAAHCYPSGAQMHNAICTNGCVNISGSNALMGTVGSRDVADGGTDTEVLQFRASSLVFTGAIGSPQIAHVSGYTSNPEGYEVCTDGSYDGEICNNTIIKNHDICMVYPGRNAGDSTACHLVRADNPTGAAGGHGDSGGPVFRFIGSGLYATGLMSAGGGAEEPCPANQFPGRTCRQVEFSSVVVAQPQPRRPRLNPGACHGDSYSGTPISPRLSDNRPGSPSLTQQCKEGDQ